jgi:hypothetical protein
MKQEFNCPEDVLFYLRENTNDKGMFTVEVPDDPIARLLLVSQYRQQYRSPVMETIHQMSLIFPISLQNLSEMLGRVERFHSCMKQFGTLDIDSVISIRKEVRKRKPLYKNLRKLKSGKIDYILLKAILSGVTRFAIEHEQRVGDITDAISDLSLILEIVYSGLRIGLSASDVEMLRFIFLGE